MKKYILLILMSAVVLSPIMAEPAKTISYGYDLDFTSSDAKPGSISWPVYPGWFLASFLITLSGGTIGGAINGIEGFLPGALICTAVSTSLAVAFMPDKPRTFNIAVLGCAAGWLLCILPMMTIATMSR